jgi:hypothetical protein
MADFDITQEVLAAKRGIEFEELKRARWRVLRILSACSPSYGSDLLIHSVFVSVNRKTPERCPDLLAVQRMMQYLEDKGYCTIAKGEDWRARLLPPGVDFIENHSLRDDGIVRGDG